jgi:hypothetical protein
MSLFNDASLIVTPNGYKEGKIYSLKPFNGSGDLGFVRNTTATRVNSVGLVELVPYNLLTYSEMFNNVAWSKIASSVTVNATTAPNGTITADKLIEDSSNNQHRLDQNTTSVIGTNTFTVYAKKAERDSVWLRVGTSGAYFDLTNGTISGISGVTASIESLPDGWYRCTILRTTTVANEIVRINLAIGINGTYTGTIGNGLFIWGAQLVEGTQAKDYFATETRLNIPRLDYSNGSCPSILVEPQRTNLNFRSEDFNNWSVKINVNTTANYDISPNGTQNGTRLQFTSNGFLHDNSFTQVTGTVYTISVWAKRNNIGNQNFGFFINGTGSVNIPLTLTNSWQRFTFTYTASNNSRAGLAGLNGADISVFGFQIEAGAYATSYIPTVASTVTRNYDVPSLGNNYTSGRITANGGTWFVHLVNNVPRTRDSGGGIGLKLTNVAGNNMFHISTPSGTNQRYWIRKIFNGVNSDLYNTISNEIKVAIKWNGTTADIFVNNIKVVNSTAFTSVDLENLNVNNGNIPYNINLMALFPTPLTDQECIDLTTL